MSGAPLQVSNRMRLTWLDTFPLAKEGSGTVDKKSLCPSQPGLFLDTGHVQVMHRSWSIPAGFGFRYLCSLPSLDRPKSWSLGTLEVEVACVQQSGEMKGSQGGLLEWRTGGHEGTERR